MTDNLTTMLAAVETTDAFANGSFAFLACFLPQGRSGGLRGVDGGWFAGMCAACPRFGATVSAYTAVFRGLVTSVVAAVYAALKRFFQFLRCFTACIARYI